MLDISQIRLGTVVKHDSEPYVVLLSNQKQVGRGGSIKTIKIKNLISGKVLELTLQGNEKMAGADLVRGKATYLYGAGSEAYFMDSESYEQFSLEKENIGNGINFLKDGAEVTVLNFEGRPVAVQLPIKIDLVVTEAPPGIKGDTAGTATKVITLETGFQINAPLFIREGDVIRINTETGEYVERVKC